MPVSMNAPAEIRRSIRGPEPTDAQDEVVIARGPLVIMAHGLLALDADMRARCWISSPDGELDAHAAEEVLRRWRGPVKH
jgi:hypothetical protein